MQHHRPFSRVFTPQIKAAEESDTNKFQVIHHHKKAEHVEDRLYNFLKLFIDIDKEHFMHYSSKYNNKYPKEHIKVTQKTKHMPKIYLNAF